MKRVLRSDPKVKEYLSRLGNPYACLQVCDDVPESTESHAETLAGIASTEIPDHQNPYAHHYYHTELGNQDDVASTASAPWVKGSNARPVSQVRFRRECRRIFLHYIPAIEKGRLRPHYLAFMNRNAKRSGAVRSALLGQLRKYDLSDIPGLKAQFNRERAELTVDKLLAIENAVLGDSGQL